MKSPYTTTRVFFRSLKKLKLLAAFLGIDQPDALDRILDEALSARNVPLPEQNENNGQTLAEPAVA